MAMWNPWRGCHRYSEGCKFCYIHKGDARRGVDTNQILRAVRFDAPVERNKDGSYQIAGGQMVYVCFSSDFLLPEADPWRPACWEIIRQRPDLQFLFLTKRIERLEQCLPPDWGAGYEHVTVGCTVENQKRADERLAIFQALPIKHRNIICQPMLTHMDITSYLNGVELVVAGGECDRNARILDYGWVLDLRQQCVAAGVAFVFRQCSSHFSKDGKIYHLRRQDLCQQVRRANINYIPD